MEKKKILIIDDDERFTGIIKLNLGKFGGYEVVVENQGCRGVTAAKEFLPGLILLDIVMPDISGDEVAVALKKEEKTKDIPIVFLTAMVKREETDSSDGVIGGKVYVSKPLTLKELIEVIDKYYVSCKP